MSSLKSMTDVAYSIMSSKKRSIPFVKLWNDVSEKTGANVNRMAQFYTDLTLDNRFVSLKDNKWDLKERRNFSETQINVEELEIEDEEETEEYDETPEDSVDGFSNEEEEDY